MNRNRTFIWGVLQISIVICVVGGLLAAIVGFSLWRQNDSIALFAAKSDETTDFQPFEVQPASFDVTLPSTLPGGERAAPVSQGGTSLAEQLPPPIPLTIERETAEQSGPVEAITPLPAQANNNEQTGTTGNTAPQGVAANNSQTVPANAGSPVQPPSLPPGVSSFLALPERAATRVVIPTMSLDSAVLISPIVGQTWDVSHLDQEIGHLQGTASPGDNNNIVLAAHVTLAPDGRAGPFINLNRLAPGDPITVYQGTETFTYRVENVRSVKPTDIHVTYPSNEAKLTLITCLNYNRNLGRYEDRLVVVGHLEQQN